MSLQIYLFKSTSDPAVTDITDPLLISKNVPDKFIKFSTKLKSLQNLDHPEILYISESDFKLALQWWFKLGKADSVLPKIESYADIPKIRSFLDISLLKKYENISIVLNDTILSDFCKSIRTVITKPIPILSIDKSKHSSKSSLWITLAGFVFDVTSFISTHPGGDQILDGAPAVCGDSISLFQTWHYSDKGFIILPQYLIGRVEKSQYFSNTSFADPLEGQVVEKIHKIIFSVFPALSSK